MVKNDRMDLTTPIKSFVGHISWQSF